MSFDFRSSQIRTNKLISSGSTGTNAKLLVYDIAADGVPANQGNINTTIFPTSSIGTDVFIYFSGSSGTRGIGGTYGTIVFGGDIYVSGTTYLSSSTVTGNMTVSNILSASTLTANTLSGYNLSASLISGSEIKVSNGIILSPLLSSSFGEAQSYNSGKILFESNSGSLVLNNNGSYEIISTNKNILQKLDISNYKITSTGVSASAEVICQYPIMSSELSKLVPSTGNGRLSSFKLKVVLSTTTGSLPAYVRLLNLSTPAYIDISGENTYILSSSSLTPTVITSSNILVDPNFNYNDSIYELQLFSSGSGSGSAILGSAQFIFN